MEGKRYSLAINNGPNHLHGGIVGFDRLMWAAESRESAEECSVRFQVVSPDGQEGYPGELQVSALYRWNNDNELTYQFEATTSAATVINMTNHSYWNLGGEKSGLILDHEVKMFCNKYLAVDDTLIPTGEFATAAGTPLDFHDYRRLGDRIQELTATKGYDHCFVVNGEAGKQPRPCGLARDPNSGRVMEVLTTQPGVQLYTGNFLDGIAGKNGRRYSQFGALCLEAQVHPDAIHHDHFPDTVLKHCQTYQQKTVYKFCVS